MEDEWRIRNVLELYCRHLDDCDYEALLPLFAPDAVFLTMGQELKGRAGIRAFFPETPEPLPPRPVSQHLLSNFIIEVDGETATAETDWCLTRRSADGPTAIILAGRYRDRFARIDGTWMIAHRQAIALARSTEK